MSPNPNPNPTVSAIILNFKSPKDTVECAKALHAQTIGDQIEILIVDNHSDDDSMGILRNTIGPIPVQIIETPTNLGYGQGNNFGARYASGEYILIVNPDSKLEPSGVEKMMRAMEEDPTIGLIAPKLQYPDGSVRDSYRGFPSFFEVAILRTFFRRSARFKQMDVPTKRTETDWVHGACFLMRRSFFEQLGGFDHRFFLFFEDTDLCRRVWQAGKKVFYDPAIIVYDRKQRLSEGGVLSFFTKWTVRVHVKSALLYFLKWGFRTS